jgi:tRNA(Ile)-lysidine synthase
MVNFLSAFQKHWNDRHFPKGKTPVLVAVSGGVDSMVLAELLFASNIPFAVAHVNFRLRGGDADGDAAFVKHWCERSDVPFFLKEVNTKEYAESRGLSTQVAARELRYDWFEELRVEHGFSHILTAHHADDVAETMLINLSRGTGIAGLHGIPERQGYLLRPLLFARRSDILDFAKEFQIRWREDNSNAGLDYLRNVIRHEVLSRLELHVPGAGMRIAETAGRVAESEKLYRKALEKELRPMLQSRGRDWYVPVRLLQKKPNKDLLAFELFSRFGFSSTQIPGILSLLESGSGKHIAGEKYRVLRNRDFLIITDVLPQSADLVLIEEIPGVIETPDGTFSFSWIEPPFSVSEDPNVAMFDAHCIELPLTLRSRKEGDYFYPLGMGGKKKKLKRFLIDARVPQHEKDRIRILESGKRIMWVAGMRLDERFKVKADTKKVLKIVFEP